MTTKTLEQMAEDSGLRKTWIGSSYGDDAALARFAATVAERCAAIVDAQEGESYPTDCPAGVLIAARLAILAEFPKP